MILKVSRLGHPVLRSPLAPVAAKDITDPKFQDLIDDMIQTMHEYDGVGIAANQVHVAKQLCVIEVQGNPRYPQAERIPLTVLINPRILATSNKREEDWEGCLSIPDLRGKVPRHEWVEVEALDRGGSQVKFRAEGFFARVIQHETDHLAGKLFIDRMPNLSTLTHLKEFMRYVKEG